MGFSVRRVVMEMGRNGVYKSSLVPGRQCVLSASCQSQVQIGLDGAFQVSFVLTGRRHLNLFIKLSWEP